ncbi:MAG TPA: hypothetical protein DFR83_15365, partial [Deltaproteobacteria bacterium]|nr:hypothetical protein [Deltaproteobacteria bacterium]
GEGEGEGAAGGQVRLAHFGVFPMDANTEVDVYVDGRNSYTFGFKETSIYVPLPAGTYKFDIVPTGADISEAVLTVPEFAVADGDAFSVYAAGYVDSAADGSALSIGAFAEDTSDLEAGKVRVTVVHAAAAAAFSPVDVWVVDDGCAPDSPLLTDFNFGDNGSVDLDGTAVNVGLDAGQDGTVDACFKIPAVEGVADKVVTVYAVNTDAGVPSLVAHLPDGSNAEIPAE